MSVRRGTLAAALLVTGVMLTGCASSPGRTTPAAAARSRARRRRPRPRSGRPRRWAARPHGRGRVVAARIPGLGRKIRAEISPKTSQAVVVTGDGPNSNRSEAVVDQREVKTGWQPVSAVWPAHNALRGWTHHHLLDDLRSPVGVFGLTDAGGSLADPGSQLPYHRSTGFEVGGRGSKVSRSPVPSTMSSRSTTTVSPALPPLNGIQPLGAARGGGIWLHVDHGGPTHGCVSFPPEARLKQLLGWLDPAKHPVVVMGGRGVLESLTPDLR